MYSPRDLFAFPPPEERKPRTISTMSSASRRRSGVESSSSCMILCLTLAGNFSYSYKRGPCMTLYAIAQSRLNSYLRCNFLSDLSKGANGIHIFSKDNMRNIINNNHGLSMYESIENVLLQSLMVILDILSLSNFEGVVAVREDDGGQLVLIVQEVAAMEVGDGHLVFTPEGKCTKT